MGWSCVPFAAVEGRKNGSGMGRGRRSVVEFGHVKAEISVSYPNGHVSERSQQKDWAGRWHADSD